MRAVAARTEQDNRRTSRCSASFLARVRFGAMSCRPHIALTCALACSARVSACAPCACERVNDCDEQRVAGRRGATVVGGSGRRARARIQENVLWAVHVVRALRRLHLGRARAAGLPVQRHDLHRLPRPCPCPLRSLLLCSSPYLLHLNFCSLLPHAPERCTCGDARPQSPIHLHPMLFSVFAPLSSVPCCVPCAASSSYFLSACAGFPLLRAPCASRDRGGRCPLYIL